MKKKVQDRLLTTHQAAKLLGTEASSVVRWFDQGILRGWRTPGGHRRIEASSVRALAASRQGEGTAASATLHEQASHMPPPASIGRYRLLWVDEQSHRLSALEDEINVYKKDVETLLIGDPVVALIEIGRFQPDLLVLDSQLESISPATICHAVKHHLLSEHLRIVMLKDVDHTDMVLPAGAHAVLTRPVTLPQVLTQLP